MDIESLSTYLNDKGYLAAYLPDHPHANKGFVLVHRLVMEQIMERYIETSEVVHHINENKTDNRPENLFLCTSEEHVHIHNRGRKNSLAKRAKIQRGVMEANRRNRKKERGQGA